MTSLQPTISATCKQTRFHLLDDKPSREVDVQGLNIIVNSPRDEATNDATTGLAKAKAKSKSKSEGLELITSADLRLKGGVHYGLVGRNGTGKSTILRAMAEKLIPGIPYSTRIAILQQIDEDFTDASGSSSSETDPRKVTVLQQVMTSDATRNEIDRKIKVLSTALDDTDNPLEPVQVVRKLRHEKLERQLFLAHRNANLRSGSRGLQARKELKAIEAKVAASADLLKQEKEEIGPVTLQEEMQSAVDLLGDLQSQFEDMKIVDIELEARKVLIGLGFAEKDLGQPFISLSGGWKMRAMLAGVLIQGSDIMILDEPTNYLDLLGVIWLENYLKRMRENSETTLVLVSHDRDFMNSVCEEIIVLKDQSLTYFRGNISAYEKDLKAQKLYWGRMKEAQERQIAHMESTIRDNIKIGKKTGDDNKLRMAKSRQKKVDERMGVQVSATGGRFKLNRDRGGFHNSLRDEIEVPADEKGVSMVLPRAPDLRFPGPLVSMEGITFRYGPGKPVVLNDIDLVIHMGDRVGIMGLNGCGKSTLLKLLVGQTTPTQGTISMHPRLKLVYYSQHAVEQLQKAGSADPGLTALSMMLKEVDSQLTEGEVRGLLGSMGLPGRTVVVPVRLLSGGQLVRLALAKILWNPPHILVLDEITTHLDFHTVIALSSALSSFNGALMLVSHDRFLMRSVIENKRDEDEESAENVEEEETEEEQSRTRVVYVVKGGKLVAQSGGVEQFEQSLEKRVAKMLRS